LDGRVYFFNNTDQGYFRITFIDPSTLEERIVEVGPGETKELTWEIVPGGTVVTLKIFFRYGIDYTPTEPELSVTVDGNVTVVGLRRGEDFFVRAGDREIELIMWH